VDAAFPSIVDWLQVACHATAELQNDRTSEFLARWLTRQHFAIEVVKSAKVRTQCQQKRGALLLINVRPFCSIAPVLIAPS
jgi:hypothetical protein